MSIKINKRLFVFALMLIILCEPVAISFSKWDLVFKAGKILIFLYVLSEILLKNRINRMSSTFFCLILYEIILLVSTIFNGTSIYHWILYGMTFVSIFFISEKMIREYKEDAIYVIAIVFFALLFINLVCGLFNIGIIAKGTIFYFLGIRTRVTDSVYVLLLALILCKKKYRFLLFASLTLIVGSMIVFNVSTMYVGVIIFFVLSLLYKCRSFRRIVSNKRILLYLSVALVSVIIFRVQELFEPIFALLGKSTDLTYRTYIWDSAIEEITSSSLNTIIGHGVTELGEWARFEGRRWQAHNQFLQVALDGGIIALLIFAYMIKKAITYCVKHRENYRMYLCVTFVISYIIMMIAEIYSYYPQFYLILSMIANVEYLEIMNKD